VIARLRGRVVAASPRCVVEVGGVGFEVAIPDKDREVLSPHDGETLFHTHLVVREDRMSLFGFLHREDRDLFLRLIEVSGVGPKIALAALAQHSAGRVAGAIRGGDSTFLFTIPGIGKKTAERIVVELADKLDDLAAAPEPQAPVSTVREEVLLALGALGMTRSAAESALDKMEWNAGDDNDVADVVRRALRHVGGG